MKIVVVGVNEHTIEFVREMVRLGHEVVIFDDKRELIERLEAELDIAGAMVDFLNLDDLESFGFSRADVVVLAHQSDAINVTLSTYAKSVGIPRIVVLTSDSRLANILTRLGLASDTVVVGNVLSKTLVSLLRGISVVDLPGNYAVAVINSRTLQHLAGVTIGEIKDRWRVRILQVVSKEGELRELADDYIVKEGDVLIVLAEKAEELDKLSA